MSKVTEIRKYHHIGDVVQVNLDMSDVFNGLVTARFPINGRYYYSVRFGSGTSLRMSQDDIVNNLTRSV